MKKKGLFLLDSESYAMIYGPDERRIANDRLEWTAAPQTRSSIAADPTPLRDAQIILSGWGCPYMDAAFLDGAPQLEAVFYGAGTIRAVVSDAFWERNIIITSAYAANAIPVAEHTLAQILFGLKCGWQTTLRMRRVHRWEHASRAHAVGAYESTIGLISLGMVARHLCRLLRAFDLRIIAYDPYVSAAQAAELGVRLVSIDEVFSESRVVSLHAPNLPETAGLVTGAHFSAMLPYATFINTARGAIVRENEMIAALQNRPDLTAVLDVTAPEPPVPDSPLWTLPNVVLTPHMAGSMNRECRRMGQYAVAELVRHLNAEPLQWRIDRDTAKRLA